MKRLGCARLIVAVLSVLCLAVSAQAAPPQPPGAEKGEPRVTGAKVLAFGVFTSMVRRRERSVSIADGIKDTAADFKLLRQGTRVEAAQGQGVGLRYVLTGAPKGAMVLVDVAVRHPQMANPDTQLTMTHSTAQFERSIGAVEHTVWSFDTPAGLVPGEYVIELRHEGRLLARKAFWVTLRPLPRAAGLNASGTLAY